MAAGGRLSQAMAKANGKQWNDYWRTDRATTYLEALSAETGIPVSKLCLSLKGGSHQGTWIHPQVAVDLARWISAPFAVWMDGWFLTDRATTYLEALSRNREIPVTSFYTAKPGASACGQPGGALYDRGVSDARAVVPLWLPATA